MASGTTTRELAVKVSIQKGDGTTVLKEIKIGIDNIGDSAGKTSAKVEGLTGANARLEQKLQRSGQALIKMGSSASGLNQALGGLPNMLVEIGDKADNLGVAGLRMGSSMSSAFSTIAGGLGVVGLVIATFVTFYKITEQITNRMPGFKKGVEDVFTGMIDSANAAEDAARSHQQLDAEYELGQALMAKYGLTADQLNQRLKQTGGDVVKLAGQLNTASISTKNITQEFSKFADQLLKMASIQLLPAVDQVAALREEVDKALKTGNLDAAKALQTQLTNLLVGQALEERQLNQQRVEDARRTAQEIAETQFRVAREIEEGNRQAYENDQKNAEKAAEAKKKAEFDYQMFLAQSRAEGLSFLEKIWKEEEEKLKNKNKADLEIAKKGAEERKKIREEEYQQTLQMMDNLLGFMGSIPGKAGSIFSGIVSGMGGSFTSLMTNLSQGWQGMVNIAINAAGALLGVITKLFQKDWGKEVAKTTQTVYQFSGALQLTSEYLQDLEEQSKKSGDAVVTFALNLKNTIDDLGGINEINAGEIFQVARDLFSMLDDGRISAQEFSEAFGAAFQDLADFAMKYGGVYMDQLKEMIAMTKEFGVEVPEVTQFLSDQLDSLIDNVNQFGDQFVEMVGRFSDRAWAKFEEWYKRQTEIAGMAKEEWRKWFDSLEEENKEAWVNLAFLTEGELNRIKQGWDKLLMFISASIEEGLAQGRTWQEMLVQLAPSIETLIETAERFGLTATGAFAEFYDMLVQAEGAADDFARLDFFGTILDQLALFGRLGPKYIGDFFGQVKKTLAEMLGFVGGDWGNQLADFLKKPFDEWTQEQKNAFNLILPYLLQAAQYYEDMGLPLPPMLQNLLDIAEANGLITDTAPKPDPFETLNTTLIEVRDVMIEIRDALLGVGTAGTTAGNQIASAGAAAQGAWSWVEDLEFPDVPGGAGNPGRIPGRSAQGITSPLSYMVRNPVETLTVHQGERVRVEPSAQNASYRSSGSSSSGGRREMNINVPMNYETFKMYMDRYQRDDEGQ